MVCWKEVVPTLEGKTNELPCGFTMVGMSIIIYLIFMLHFNKKFPCLWKGIIMLSLSRLKLNNIQEIKWRNVVYHQLLDLKHTLIAVFIQLFGIFQMFLEP